MTGLLSREQYKFLKINITMCLDELFYFNCLNIKKTSYIALHIILTMSG